VDFQCSDLEKEGGVKDCEMEGHVGWEGRVEDLFVKGQLCDLTDMILLQFTNLFIYRMTPPWLLNI